MNELEDITLNGYSKERLEVMEDRFENYFSLPFETEELPDFLVDMKAVSYFQKRDKLLEERFSLLMCLPHLPVPDFAKQVQLLEENINFKLWKVAAEVYNQDIEDFLSESEYGLTFLWIKDPDGAVFELPKTSQQRMKVSSMKNNEIHCLWIELEECVKVVWK